MVAGIDIISAMMIIIKIKMVNIFVEMSTLVRCKESGPYDKYEDLLVMPIHKSQLIIHSKLIN